MFSKLGRVHEDTDHDPVGAPFCSLDQGQMAGMQIAHGRYQRCPVGRPQRLQRLADGRDGRDGLHRPGAARSGPGRIEVLPARRVAADLPKQ